MQDKEAQFKILELLAQHKETISYFYSACADTFQSNKQFWQEIAGEEKVHARWLRDLKPKIEMNLICLDTKKFNEQSILDSMRHLEEEKGKVNKGEYTEKEAFSVALNIEKALIESDNFKLFLTESAELKYFLDFLIKETEKHKDIFSSKLEKYKEND